ncbi:hypothetical protein CHARACLAT_009924 [Characodon lateralis]|uniref:PH domain-containing protein n=1 Tax=Characodon lateralis TaxID=208331 RepID=A0ABU7DJ79_9TELE|nr:hypothetical protein [Characodon lateralis]
MAPPAEDYYCWQFQPNTFDPSRCRSCLRPNHMHLSTTTSEHANAAELHDLQEMGVGDKNNDEDNNYEDDLALSEVTTCASSDDVSGGWTFEWNLERSPSPQWEPENCETDFQPSFLNQWGQSERSTSLSPRSPSAGQTEMTQLDPSSPRDAENSGMDERRGRDMSRRASESRGGREKESGYFSPDRRGDGVRQMEEENKRTYRYYERGHPLPNNYVPEPKACVPYRNVSLGLPSQRRNPDTYMQATWRSESPQRYTYHSNFRQGTDSERNSPTRHSSLSPDRYRLSESPVEPRRGSSHCRSQARASLQGSFQIQSNCASRHTSGRSSPSCRRGSMASYNALAHRRTDSFQLQSGEYEDHKICSKESRSLSQASNKHSLDSEKLYRNLESISHCRSSAVRQISYEGSQASPQSRTALSSLANTLSHNSREVSPSRNGYSPQSHVSLREPDLRDKRLSQSQGSWQGSSHSLPNLPSSHGSSSSRREGAGSHILVGSPSHVAVTDSHKVNEGVASWQGFSHSILSRPPSQASSSSRRIADSQVLGGSPSYFAVTEPDEANEGVGSWQGSSHSLLGHTPSQGFYSSRLLVDSQVDGSPSHVVATDTVNSNNGIVKVSSERSKSNIRRGMDALLLSEPKKAVVEPEEVGMTMDDYIVLADIPKIQVEAEETFPGLRRRNESPSPCRDQRQRSYRYQDKTDICSPRLEPDESRRGRERGRDRREKFRDLDTERQSAASLHAQTSDQSGKHRSLKVKDRARPKDPQARGWMSRLNEQGKWKRQWFVLGDTSLRYYRDSEAEESDNLDGEISLTSCVNVSDCDVEKNYGLQIQTKRVVFTLSAVTSRIRQNWVRLLKQAIQNNTNQSDSSSEKENPRSRRLSSSQPPAQFPCEGSSHEPATSIYNTVVANTNRDPTIEGDLGRDLSLATQREQGEGWDREQAKRLEERNKWFEGGFPLSEMSTRWDSMELKRGSIPVPVNETIDSEVNKKWTEFETSFRDLSDQSLIGTQAYQPSSQGEALSINSQTLQTNKAEALQKEQVETVKKERQAMGIDVDSPCGPGAPCRAKLEAMEVAHRKEMQELQEKHARERRKLEEERGRMLQEESQAAAKAIEALKAAHREELQREVEKARSLDGGAAHMDSYRGHMPQADVLHSELNVLSEHYSQKCLELRSSEQSNKNRETELDHKKKEMEQLQRENQELKTKLAEEISRMRLFITGQRSDVVSLCKTEATPSNLEGLSAAIATFLVENAHTDDTPQVAYRKALLLKRLTWTSFILSKVTTLLRAKENEVQYLKKEISCLQNEVQTLMKEKEAVYKLYKEAYVELSDTRGRSQLELGSLNEHLRLANAALQEGDRQT